jgi:RNA exonuclease 1
VHTRIVDSALLFPHGRGLPFRMSLRELAKRHLGLTIQTAGADGHSSLEDARIALE